MKICPKCGIAAVGKFCPNCGSELPEQEFDFGGAPAYQSPRTEPAKSNPFAIAGFVLSFFSPLLGLIFSIIAYQQSKDNPGSDKNFSLAGIIISVAGLVLILIVIIIYIGLFYALLSMPAYY